ncbi:MAG: nitronate monooxygenase [Pseudomonas sp.]|uniref:NAD(P)H-dependent flavin oxidoreductase n=1 Tax=Pseudomonas sp. TaxID=306 RepID=UPI0030EFB56B
MTTWPDTRLTELLGVNLPIIQAPMLGAGAALMVGVAQAGALGSLACATLQLEQVTEEVRLFRAASSAPLNLNFFCHNAVAINDQEQARWKASLADYYREVGADLEAPTPISSRAPFDEASCLLVEKLRPEIVSFHFGLPAQHWLERVKATGANVLSSATTVEEAIWLEQRGCDAIVAMGYEAGGHRGMFLRDDLSSQIGTFALVPQVVDAVTVPVIAAGGIADARGIAAAFALGAAGVQIGTAYLFCAEAKLSVPHHRALRSASSADTALTNLFTGRPARGIVNRLMREKGPLNPQAPAFPFAGGALIPLRAKTEPAGVGDFSNLWAGQAFPLSPGRATELSAHELTAKFAADYAALARSVRA